MSLSEPSKLYTASKLFSIISFRIALCTKYDVQRYLISGEKCTILNLLQSYYLFDQNRQTYLNAFIGL